MTTSIELVEQFLADWKSDRSSLERAFRRWLAPTVIWENVGLTRTVDLDQAVALIDNFIPGLESIEVEILAMSQSGQDVLTERIDHIKDAGGAVLTSIRVMGIFRIEDEQITEWRDYFDMTPFRAAPRE